MAIYTVSQVTTYLRDSLDRDPFLTDLWVSGEVSNLSHSSAGHYYFTVKDNQSQLRCVMFRSQHGGELLTNGGAVIVHGRLSLYPTRGDLQLYVDLVQPEGTGALALELERLKAQLDEEGLFEPSRKRPLPAFPRKIGVATSPTGAVFHDICNVIQRRYPLVEIILSPTPVQGTEAAQPTVSRRARRTTEWVGSAKGPAPLRRALARSQGFERLTSLLGPVSLRLGSHPIDHRLKALIRGRVDLAEVRNDFRDPPVGAHHNDAASARHGLRSCGSAKRLVDVLGGIGGE